VTIETAPRVPPFVAMRLELAKLRASALVAMSGRGAIIDIVDAYLVATEARLKALENSHHAEAQK
jgi:hypothetical protein